jgi:predicted AlkP superfamily pyrophosphatase or phosphodiesterase
LSGAPQPSKVVLAVIDSLKPEMLEEAIAEDRAPALAGLRERGTYIPDCVSTFPSVTPVASAAIATGSGAGEHHIPSMNWFHRGEERYIEYGSSFQASRAFGIVRSLYDTVYNMNLAHLSRARKTVFEHLDDAGLRTACTTYLIYRGRTRHDPSGESVYRRIGEALQFRHPVYGARELFYADLFDSRNTGCTSALGLPGQRDRHTGCVGAYLVEHDLFDFLLFSLPDNDTHSHRVGPEGQVRSIAEADRALERIMLVAGGVDAFLEDHAVIVMSDHSQTKVDERLNLADAFPSRHVLAPADPAPTEAELALCPSARSAMVYVLDEARRPELVPEVVEDLSGLDGVDLVVTRQDGEAVVRSGRGELRFSPEGGLRDGRGRSWTVTGDRAALDLEMMDGRIASESYPDPLGRLWSALECPHTGDVLVSAAPGFECVDWGGGHHIGGGSHGSLHRDDSEGVLLISGLDVPERGEWSVEDVAPLVLDHFRVRLGG